MRQEVWTLESNISLVVAATIDAAFVYFLIPNRTGLNRPLNLGGKHAQECALAVTRSVKRDAKWINWCLTCCKSAVWTRRFQGVYRLTGTVEENPLRPLLELQRPTAQPASTFWQRLRRYLRKRDIR